MKWVTRERPKTDRIACPWLIKNFIDSEAEFVYVPAEQVLEVAEREGAHSYDAPGAKYTHRDGLCSFEVLLEEYELDDPALQLLARHVHGQRRRLYVAHTGADRIDVLDCNARTYLHALPAQLPGVAGVLIDDEHDLLFSSDSGAACTASTSVSRWAKTAPPRSSSWTHCS